MMLDFTIFSVYLEAETEFEKGRLDWRQRIEELHLYLWYEFPSA